jgi:hypothetical protein
MSLKITFDELEKVDVQGIRELIDLKDNDEA